MSVIAPRIHDNGTSRTTLMDALETVWDSLEGTQIELRRIAPNPRDYEGPEHFASARAQHADRQQAIEFVKASIAAELVEISKQTQEPPSP